MKAPATAPAIPTAISAASIVARRDPDGGGRPGALPPRAAVIASIWSWRERTAAAPSASSAGLERALAGHVDDLTSERMLRALALGLQALPVRAAARPPAAGARAPPPRDAAATAARRRPEARRGRPSRAVYDRRRTLPCPRTAALLYRSARMEAITRVGVVGLGHDGGGHRPGAARGRLRGRRPRRRRRRARARTRAHRGGPRAARREGAAQRGGAARGARAPDAHARSRRRSPAASS